MIRVGIVGATGYAGAELVRLLTGHPHADIRILTSKQFAGIPFDQVYPAFSGRVTHVCEPLAVDRLARHCDVVFTALPHRIPMQIVPDLVAAGKKVIDLSADFRFETLERYEKTYQAHTAPVLLKTSVYGLCEVFRDRIRNAGLVGNPGCYPTSTLLPLIPLIGNGLLATEGVVVDAKSGVSGAGRSLSIASHFCEVNESFKAYKVAQHRHNPEIDEVLSKVCGRSFHVTFVPHLVPMTRGMLTTIYARPAKPIDAHEIRNILHDFYEDSPFVRICQKGRLPETRHVTGTNYCDIGVVLDRACNQLILIAAIDNLVKGAAGQAVQNMNIMSGLDETQGLMGVPFPV